MSGGFEVDGGVEMCDAGAVSWRWELSDGWWDTKIMAAFISHGRRLMGNSWDRYTSRGGAGVRMYRK